MEYSLQTLNENSNLMSLKTEEMIETLNLIGFEIDDIFKEPSLTNSNLQNLRLLLKIPANREDLLNEREFLNELSRLFSFQLYNKWKKNKTIYNSILKNQYLKYKNYEKFEIISYLKEISCLQIQIEKNENFVTPLWIQKKLLNFGINPTKNIEDLLVLNTLEFGNKYDFSYLKKINNNNQKLKIEQLKANEKILAFDNKVYNLSPGTIVLKDIDDTIKNVLGLFNQNIKIDKNNNIFIQSIFYNIHENSLMLNSLENKISLRYLRQMCLQNYKLSFQRLLTILELTEAAKIIPTVYFALNNNPTFKNKKTLKLRKDSIEKILSIKSPNKTIFKKAGLKLICETKKEFYFSIPFVRNDLTREIDLIEEYARFVGYKNFKGIVPEKSLKIFIPSEKNKVFIKTFFLNSGFSEVLTNPLQDLKKQSQNSISIKNPLNNEFQLLRDNLLEKIITIFENNVRVLGKVNNFFEIGRIFEHKNGKLQEIEKIAGIFQLRTNQKTQNNKIDWFIAKGFLENFLSTFSNYSITYEKFSENNKLFHPTRSVEILMDNQKVGFFGELNPIFNLKNLKEPTYIFELHLKYFSIQKMSSSISNYKEYSKYPTVTKDISIKLSTNTIFSNLKENVKKASDLLKSVEFFDIYFDKNNKINELTIGIRLSFQSTKETLTTEIIEDQLKKINFILIENFQAKINL